VLRPGGGGGETRRAAPGPLPLTSGRVLQINVSDGGVPKRPVLAGLAVQVTRNGLRGDRQRDLRYHGGPDRAVSLFSIEVIARLAEEGHPIAPGTAGENLTLAGLDWAAVKPGCRLMFERGVALEVTAFAPPCPTIRHSFTAGHYERISDKRHPAESRVYCRVLNEGELRPGEGVVVLCGPPVGEGPGEPN
jgi:MOSC domain-containing protein YiiM